MHPQPSPGVAVSLPWARYRENLARHLIGLGRDLQSRALRSLEEAGYGGLRPSFGPFVSVVRTGERTLGAIADELAISRQACSQLANLMERAGYIAREPNEKDRRSKLVALTPLGQALVADATRLIRELDAHYAERVGAEAYGHFTEALGRLYLGFPGESSEAPVGVPVVPPRSAGVLPVLSMRIQQQLMETTIARGHPGLKLSYGQVLPLLGPEGGRIHEIARLHRVTRQAISAVSQELEALGYLQRGSDPRDGRGVVLTLTERGARLLSDSVDALDALDQRLEHVLGGARLAALQRVAADLYHALRLEEEIFEAGSAQGRSRNEDGGDIERLASRLRSRLGKRDAARLASLLEPQPRRTAT